MADVPKLYLARAGRNGEDEDLAIENNLAIIDFRDVPSLEGANDYDAVAGLVNEALPDHKPRARGNFAGQLWAFSVAMENGDLVVLPRKLASQVAIGRVTGPYEYRKVNAERRHTRPVQWLKTDIPRAIFGQDLLYSFGAFRGDGLPDLPERCRSARCDCAWGKARPRPIGTDGTANGDDSGDAGASRGRSGLGSDVPRPDCCAGPITILGPRLDAARGRRASDRRLGHEGLSPWTRWRSGHPRGERNPRPRRTAALRPGQVPAEPCRRHRLQDPAGHDANLQRRTGAACLLGRLHKGGAARGEAEPLHSAPVGQQRPRDGHSPELRPAASRNPSGIAPDAGLDNGRGRSRRMTSDLRSYPEMKDSGVGALGRVPAHWQVRKLVQIGRFSKGNGGSKMDELQTGIPCIRYGDLYTSHTYFIHQSQGRISRERVEDYTPISYGDVLFAASGETIEEIGKSAVNLIKDEAYCGGDIILFRPNIEAHPKFMGYATDFRPATDQKARMGRGFTVVHVYSDQLKRLAVPLPPLREQASIVRFLDHAARRIQRSIRAKEKLIALLEEEKQVVIHQAVTGQIDVRTGQPYPAYRPSGRVARQCAGTVPGTPFWASCKAEGRGIRSRATTSPNLKIDMRPYLRGINVTGGHD